MTMMMVVVVLVSPPMVVDGLVGAVLEVMRCDLSSLSY
jgi:hypothetical protein